MPDRVFSPSVLFKFYVAQNEHSREFSPLTMEQSVMPHWSVDEVPPTRSRLMTAGECNITTKLKNLLKKRSIPGTVSGVR
jgi:hypothetical protein